MSSSCKENVRTTTSAEGRSAPMGNSDVFSTSSPSHTLFSLQAEATVSYSTTPRSERNTKPLVSSARSNTLSPMAPMANKATKRKRTVPDSSAWDHPNAVQNPQERIMQHTPNTRMRKQLRHVVASPGQQQVALGGVSSPPRDGGQVQIGSGPMTPTRKGKPKIQSTELTARSPHASNPKADYIPPSRLVLSPRGVSVRRRSVTPIPPYEPPRERYTPPREVVVSPPADRKPARRSAAKKKRVSVKSEKPAVQLWVKTEPPEIDLTTPAPPPSPGDDPILLVGPPSIKVQRPSLPPSDLRDVSLVDFEMDLNLLENREHSAARGHHGARVAADAGPSIPPAFDFSGFNGDDGNSFNEGLADSSGEVDFDAVVDNGHLTNVVDDSGWSDSDSDGSHAEEGASVGEGDFTGKFLTFKAPLKLDPPEDENDRMEKWARPISPHPKRLSLVEPKEEEVDVDLDEARGQATGDHSGNGTIPNQPDPETDAESRGGARSGYVGKRGRRMTLSEVEAIKFGPTSLPPKQATSTTSEVGPEKEPSVYVIDDDSFVHEVGSLDCDVSKQRGLQWTHTDLVTTNILDNDSNHQIDSTHSNNNNSHQQATSPITEENDTSTRSASEHSSGESSQSTLNNSDILGLEHLDYDRNEKDGQDNQNGKDGMHDKLEDHSASLLRAPCPPNSDCETEITTEEDQEDNSDGGAGDMSVVKIMSDDPSAAARAAAILKLHDYDMVARKLRRRKTSGGVSKAYNSPRDTRLWRRRTVAGLSAEDALSANISLPQLLEKAEEELRSSPARSRCGSVALSSVGSPKRPRWHDFMYEDADEPGIREWSKADWKLLDSCFTDERYDLGEQMDLEPGCLADVDDVPLESVVGRFVMIMGGAEKVENHGPSWTMEKLMARAKALRKRQRAGHGAPPTPDVSARFASPSRFPTMSPAPSMIVPEFTPVGMERTRLFDFGSVSRKAKLPPPSSEPFFKVPSTLPARHSSLRQDVTLTVVETPRPSRALDLFGFATPSRNDQQQRQGDSDDESVAQEVDEMLTPITASRVRQSRPDSAVKRSLSYISSWLKPDMYKLKKEEWKGSQLPGLPVPPSDVLAKPRGPVETPAPKAAPKPLPHKELVSLEHVPPPQPTKIPRRQRPQRLVDLNHVPTPQPKEEMKRIASRRSSTSSVKDLIKEFEEKEKGKVQAVPPRVAELRRQASVGSLKGKGKPAWKP